MQARSRSSWCLHSRKLANNVTNVRSRLCYIVSNNVSAALSFVELWLLVLIMLKDAMDICDFIKSVCYHHLCLHV
jgi:hypothetical protein